MTGNISSPGTTEFWGRLGVVPRVLATYRQPFFEALAARCPKGLGVASGMPESAEAVVTPAGLRGIHYAQLRNRRWLPGRLHVYWQSGLLRWLERWDPHAIIVEANPRLLTLPWAARWMHQRGRPIIGWGLGTMHVTPRLGPLRGLARARLFRHLDGVIAYGSRARDDYIALGMSPERVFVACNAVARRPSGPPPVRALHDQPVHLLFVGRLIKEKRLENLFEACRALPAPGPRVTIVGDGPERARYEELARRRYPQAMFVGSRHGPELAPFWAVADLVVLPGQGGLVLQEAIGQGLPVVVAEGDGTQDDLVRPANGWQVAPRNVRALTSVLLEAVPDLPRLRRMGAESHKIAQSINVESMVESFLSAVNSLAPAPRIRLVDV